LVDLVDNPFEGEAMKKEWRSIKIRSLYKGFLGLNGYTLRHTLFDGGWSGELVRERVESFHAAAVLPYDPRADALVLIEQFRIGALEYPGGPWLLEVVGGIVEAGESPQQVARRETLEEAGCEVRELVPIADYLVTPGTSSERMTLFCGIVESSGAGGLYGLSHEGEDIRAEVIPYHEVMARLDAGEMSNSTILIALQWLRLNRERLRNAWLGC
jgi:ADP-ribose pyrophosphatase